ncbi:MAG: CoA-binding protein, partial [Deltaproteobacteria bacterium]|nr:CoA-binding protein [Deltaproteobacteria bacterium]
SLGNECDLTSADFLTYLGHDTETGVIGAYLEGITDGPYFLKALKRASKEKPVILWKVGQTPEGSRAASSHTGAMAGSRAIWEAVVRQGGAVPVFGFEALVDALMGFSLLPQGLGDRIAILSGPGGLAVATAEACGNMGLGLAELSAETRSMLAQFVPPTGTSLRNPVDVGLTASMEIDIYTKAARLLAADPGVDGVVVLGRGANPELDKLYTESLIQARKDYDKPFVMVGIPGFESDMATAFCQAGLPFFETAERAMA